MSGVVCQRGREWSKALMANLVEGHGDKQIKSGQIDREREREGGAR